MAEMLIQSENLTSIADEIRVLSGTEDGMGLDDMVAHIEEANTDVATEAVLIEQIASALEGKAGGGSTVQIATGSFENFAQYIECGFSPDIICVHLPEPLIDGIESLCSDICCFLAVDGKSGSGLGFGRYGTVKLGAAEDITECHTSFDRVESGFLLSSISETKNGVTTYPSKTYTYTAIKYT